MSRRFIKPMGSLGPLSRNTTPAARPIRVGFACSFLDSYVVKSQLGEALRETDKSRFALFGYASEPVSAGLRGLFHTVRSTGAMSDAEFVRLVRSDEIDIFIELSGFSPFNRFAAMASRCAPVQVSYLNHTGTSAVPDVDYVLTDSICTPPGHEKFFTEQLYRLPGCFFCFDYRGEVSPAVAPAPFKENGFITFGTFSSGGKINEPLIALWSRILLAVPDSQLLLSNLQLAAKANMAFMASRFERYGIPAQRLRLAPGADRQTILRTYGEIDISLDTWPYCGGNSVAEAIWQGVPVVTLKGDRFSSRYGASLVTAAGCPELVAESADQYVRIAAELAASPARLSEYRSSLREKSVAFGLSDSKRFARSIEVACADLLKRACGSNPVFKEAKAEFTA
jgi:predicted O-linked N-acetylglucosamine transferase (SPINDLY family)